MLVHRSHVMTEYFLLKHAVCPSSAISPLGMWKSLKFPVVHDCFKNYKLECLTLIYTCIVTLFITKGYITAASTYKAQIVYCSGIKFPLVPLPDKYKTDCNNVIWLRHHSTSS